MPATWHPSGAAPPGTPRCRRSAGKDACAPHSYHSSIRNRPILWHDDDPIANVVTSVRAVNVLGSRLVQQLYLRADARVLVDDCTANDRILADTQARSFGVAIRQHVFQGLIVICAHDVRGFDLHALADPGAQSD